jgi:hypothetical protein
MIPTLAWNLLGSQALFDAALGTATLFGYGILVSQLLANGLAGVKVKK